MTSPNTITKAHIDDLIARSQRTDAKMGEKTTVVCLKLPNGYEIIESSGCVDPANYNHDMGVKICMERIVNRVWQLEGYRLQCELFAETASEVMLRECRQAAHSLRCAEIIARVAHEVNRAYCQSQGDNSQPAWKDAPAWQTLSAINGVRFHLANPNADASASHESWLKEKLEQGWTFGLVKDPVAKTHPCCVPFESLPKSQQTKDYLFRAVVHAMAGLP